MSPGRALQEKKERGHRGPIDDKQGGDERLVAKDAPVIIVPHHYVGFPPTKSLRSGVARFVKMESKGVDDLVRMLCRH